MGTEGSPQDEDTFKILLATDTHLGFEEKDPIREHDSFLAFEEVLQQAVENEVDFILLGGDLFHEAKPSPYCLTRCLELLRKYCLGDRPVSIEFYSDQSANFQHLRNPMVNYEDPNLNVAIPVFSIHGNHDDPTGSRQVSALDLLASTGLINYFGRWNSLSRVEIQPILLKKGTTKLALYGLSHIRDERLGRLFRDKKIIMSQPKTKDWFNMFVLHQNRVPHGTKNFIPDTSLPSFLDLVIWGHEHDCRIAPEPTPEGVYISQPGSSVATSLATGEAIPKKIGLLQVHGKEFVIHPIPLTKVRPFLYEELELEHPTSRSYNRQKPKEQAIKQVEDKINEMIAEATEPNRPMPPLLRLKVFYHNELQEFNPLQLGQRFAGRVANPSELIKLLSSQAKDKRRSMNFNDDDEGFDQFINTEEWASSVEEVLAKYYNEKDRKYSMKVLSVKGLTDAVARYVQKDDHEALKIVVDNQTKKTVDKLMQLDPDIDDVDQVLETLMRERLNQNQASSDDAEIQRILDDENRVVKQDPDTFDDELAIVESQEEPRASTSRPARGRGSRGGRMARAPRGRARAAKANTSNYACLDSFLD